MDLPAEQLAETDGEREPVWLRASTESDGETEKIERLYDETLQYLMYDRYL